MKWVGGKRQLLPELAKYVPEHFGTYFEPFLGGGAFLLALSPEHAVINDFNPELVVSWMIVRDRPEELLKQLKQHQLNHSKEYYLHLRAADRDGRLEKMTLVQRAARFIYMNKTGFNGLWRVNKKGQNNVPFGSYKNPNISDKDTIKPAARYLNDAQITITNADFEKAILDAQTGDFVYFDPPYIPISETSSFTAYSSDFGYDQQVRLRDVFVALHQKGVHVMLSNSDVPLIEKLYGHIDGIVIEHVSVTHMVAAKASSRKKVGEVIVHGK
ncbi:MAG: DNA adenine methylase [Leuconostoc gelidum]|uniref:DNA adenine methylase n=1 Tax=Leuconostoc gelidum TaxID=1244 RepID=UPI0015776150|nr:DNA adenine methylase [Leuconostoc gelidum subsp. gelidum]MBZ6000912.1 DNA adenine methylase [Leuconostoc gelidum subsp. gelidum]QDJ30754.1 modification methylase [Leuconostoc gelidum subsp. gelidum]